MKMYRVHLGAETPGQDQVMTLAEFRCRTPRSLLGATRTYLEELRDVVADMHVGHSFEAAGCVTISRIPDEPSSMFLLEVMCNHRRGRGRYWRPGSAGYTDSLHNAGLFRGDSEEIRRTERAYPVHAKIRIQQEIEKHKLNLLELKLMLQAAGERHG